jgi:hypothetical protein
VARQQWHPYGLIGRENASSTPTSMKKNCRREIFLHDFFDVGSLFSCRGFILNRSMLSTVLGLHSAYKS